MRIHPKIARCALLTLAFSLGACVTPGKPTPVPVRKTGPLNADERKVVGRWGWPTGGTERYPYGSIVIRYPDRTYYRKDITSWRAQGSQPRTIYSRGYWELTNGRYRLQPTGFSDSAAQDPNGHENYIYTEAYDYLPEYVSSRKFVFGAGDAIYEEIKLGPAVATHERATPYH